MKGDKKRGKIEKEKYVANKPRYGIFVDDENYVSVSNNFVEGTGTYDIYLTSGGNNKVTGNIVPDGKVSLPSDASYIVKDNIGFVTENTGTTSAGTEIQVSHGLAGTPNRTIITPRGETNYSYTHDIGASVFNITSQASVVFDWYAIYEP